jgi:hypothetical protein
VSVKAKMKKIVDSIFVCLLAMLIAGGPAFARGGGGRGGGGGGRGMGGGGRSMGGGGGRSFSGGGGHRAAGGGGRSFSGGGGRSYGGGGRSYGGGGHSFGGGGGRSFGSGGSRNFGSSGSRNLGGGGGLSGRDFSGNRGNVGGGDRGSHFGGSRERGSGFGGGNDGLAGMAGSRGDFGGARPSQLPARDFGGGARPSQLPGRDLGNRGTRIDRGNLPNRPVQMPGAGGGLAGMAGSRPRPTQPINRQNLGNQASNIRGNYYGGNRYNQINHYGGYGGRYNGYHGYPGWNGHGGYYPYNWSGAAWGCVGGAALGSLLGIAINRFGDDGDSSAVNNVVYEGDNVYVNGESAGSAQQYYDDAQQLALAPVPEPDWSSPQEQQWQPLGVFALATPGAADSTTMIQLAVNQYGAVEGNYLNQLTGETAPLKGTIDKKSQRVSWTLGNNVSTVFDTSLPSLLADQTDVLVHYGADNTQQMIMVRLPEPPEQAAQPMQAAQDS